MFIYVSKYYEKREFAMMATLALAVCAVSMLYVKARNVDMRRFCVAQMLISPPPPPSSLNSTSTLFFQYLLYLPYLQYLPQEPQTQTLPGASITAPPCFRARARAVYHPKIGKNITFNFKLF
jgi:hypothetical protein